MPCCCASSSWTAALSLCLSASATLPEHGLEVDGLVVEGITALVGPSGTGKTTVLEYVAGLRAPEAGRITCADEVWLDSSEGIALSPARRRVGYVPQDLALFPHLTARENVAWGAPGTARERRSLADGLLERFDISSLAGRRAASLSGGERRRVALARALAREPSALLLDEPFTGLDASARADATEVVRAACEDAGVPALMVSHDFLDVARVAGRVAVMETGKITQVGTPAEVASSPRTPFAAALVGVNAFPGNASPDGPLTQVARSDGPPIISDQPAAGPVLASVHPTDIRLSRARPSDVENALPGRVVTRLPQGARMRVELALPQVLVAEVPAAAVDVAVGERVWATWTARATRLAERV